MPSAPRYDWTCHVCGAANAPNTGKCSSCRSDAVLTGEEIELLRNGQLAPHLVRDRREFQAKDRAWSFFALLSWLLFLAPFKPRPTKKREL